MLTELGSVGLFPTGAQPSWLLWKAEWSSGSRAEVARAIREKNCKPELSQQVGIKPGSPGRIFFAG